MSFRLIKDMVALKLGLQERAAPRGPLGLGLGRAVAFEEAPFILIDGAIPVAYPGGQCLVIGHGTVEAGGITAHRYYLSAPGGRLAGLLQVVENTECRFFVPFDEVYPASGAEWAFWLADEDGYIGYPSFEAKGRLYQRLWNPGRTRVAPLSLEESVSRADGGNGRAELSSMLYGRTVATPGGEAAEYLLVSAVRTEEGVAWVDLMLGIDLLPSAVTAF